MTSTSPRLGLVVPTQADQFSTQDLADNWGKVDAAPGTLVCTSTSRPTTWTNAQKGRKIIETDTGLEWSWSGSVFTRVSGTGLLRRSDGSRALAQRNQDFASGYTTFYVVCALTGVVVPDGNRPLRLDAYWVSGVTKDAPNTPFGAIFQSASNQAGAQIVRWKFIPGPTIGSDNHANFQGG